MAPTEGRPSDGSGPRSLQITEDMPFQRRSWAVERIGWIVMAVLILAGLLGLFSNGPLSSATAWDPAGLVRLDYQRFARYDAPSTLSVTFSHAPGSNTQGGRGETAALRIGRTLIEAVRIESVEPEPQQVSTGPDGAVLTFRLSEPGKPGTVQIAVRPDRFGPIHAEIGLLGQEPIRFTQFIYP